MAGRSKTTTSSTAPSKPSAPSDTRRTGSTKKGCETDHADAIRLIEANTAPRATALCPEITLSLLREDAPLWQAAGRRLFAHDGPAPYWGFAWASGQALARYLLDHPQWVRGRRVVDFGSGSGIAAIAAAKAAAAEVIATDIDPVALAAIERNAALNGVSVATSPANLIDGEQHPWEVLLVADVCYRWVQQQWVASLADRDGIVLIADPARGGLPVDNLQELARFAARTVPELEHADLVEAAVYRFRKAGIPETIPPTQ